jgi:hypothetical protein
MIESAETTILGGRMANPSIKEVLEVLQPSFKSIDLRAVIVALGDGQGWQNVFIVVRFSARTVEEILAEHDRLKKLYELPSRLLNKRLGIEHNVEPYRGINVELSAYPADHFEQLVRRLDKGIVDTSNRAFRVFPGGLDLMQQETYLWQNLDYEDIGDHWPVYYWGQGEQQRDFTDSLEVREITDKDWVDFASKVASGKKSEPALKERDVDKQAHDIGFSGIQELVERVTERPFRRGSGHAFEILLPVYARIKSVAPSFDTVDINGHFHQALGELVVECSLFEQTQWERALGRSLGKKRIIPTGKGQDILPFSIRFPLKESPESGRVRVSLFKQGATRVDLHSEQSSLKSGVLTFRTFASFVPEEDITEYLGCLTSGTSIENCRIYQRFTPKDSSKKKDELIEYVVTYLFSLCQLNPLLLSNPQYDVIHGGLEAGSADIVASTQSGTPALVSCTMAMPDARKRNMLLAARTAIANRLNVPLEAIKMLLITGKPSVSPSGTELLELAAADLERLWEMCRQGNLSEARRLLGFQ